MVTDKWGFDTWAETYDKDVLDESRSYYFTFKDYHRVLDTIVEYADLPGKKYMRVLDIGIGTGNLAGKFLEAGLDITGIDPSREMMKICREKHPEIPVIPGDFLNIPLPPQSIDLIVSSYAFHHLTPEEKAEAAYVMKRVLRPGGRIIIADLMFRNAAERKRIEDSLRRAGRDEIVEEYQEEYPGFFEDIVEAFDKAGFVTDGEQLTQSVWIIRACL